MRWGSGLIPEQDMGDTTILLIRHARHADYGNRLSGRSEAPLTAVGLRQADALGARLAGRGESLAGHGEKTSAVTRVQSSPRRRAAETALAIAEACGLIPETHDALDEIDFGEWTERSFLSLDRDPLWRAWNVVRASARPPGGESQIEATARAVAHIEATARAHPGETIGLVTHCDIIRGVVCHYLGLRFDNLLRFDIDAASVSTLSVSVGIVGIGGARVTGLNDKGEA